MLIIGAYPPPIGGNSVHIKRLRDELCARDICCDVADIYGMPDSTESPMIKASIEVRPCRSYLLRYGEPSVSCARKSMM